MSPMTRLNIAEVERFWHHHSCGSDTSIAKERKRYFQEIERYRYSNVRNIVKDARFPEFAGKRVLEVGCGVGTDGLQFAKNRAIYTGINLDEGSTRLAREVFDLAGMSGNILQMDGEDMKFPDNAFDHVYSFGVIHHTPNPERMVGDIFRILKPGGTFCAMVYNRSSVNYYFEIMFLRKMFRYALMPSFAPKLFSKLGIDRYKLQRHREIMLSEKMTHERWISINTDGPDNPLSRVFSRREAICLFTNAGFSDVHTNVRFFDKNHYGFLGKLMSNGLTDRIGKKLGWHRWVEGTKP